MARTTRRRRRGESNMGFFRNIIQDDRSYITSNRNEELMDQWKAAHPTHSVVELKKARQSLANLKTTLRRANGVLRGGSRKAVRTQPARQAHAAGTRTPLATLEANIDECLLFAKNLDRAGLDEVIDHLRLARNAVVVKNS